MKADDRFILKYFQESLGANEVKEEPSELLMKKVMSTEASIPYDKWNLI